MLLGASVAARYTTGMKQSSRFGLLALLVVILVVAAFLGGMATQHQLEKPLSRRRAVGPAGFLETMTLRDGTKWYRVADESPTE
jgi:hypothetical protein